MCNLFFGILYFCFLSSLICESVILNLVAANTNNLGLHLYEEVGVLTLAVEVSGSPSICWLLAPFLCYACPHTEKIFIFDLLVVFSFSLLYVGDLI